MDYRGMEDQRTRTAREVLFAHPARTAGPGPGNRELAAPTSAISRVLALKEMMTSCNGGGGSTRFLPGSGRSSARGAWTKDLDDELAFHVAMQSRANARDGMSDGEAYRRARVDIGGVEQVKERSRDVRPLRWARDAIQDVRYGLRGLRKTPRFTIAAVLTVVLGVGANATIFSALNPLLFKPLPYPEPDRIVHVWRTSPKSDRWPHSVANYLDHRERNTVFEQLAALTWENVSFAEPG